MTNLEDALTAVDAGADAVGFVFYEKSPRNISVEAARAIVEKLPESAEKVGVFVDETADAVIRTAEEVGLDAVQLYPNAKYKFSILSADFTRRIRRRVYIAFPPKLVTRKGLFGFQVSRQFQSCIRAVLFDSGSSERPGGTGRKFDWENVAPIAEGLHRMSLKLVVAGGLSSVNVGEAMHVLKPWGVDVVSGVESRPGKKDPDKVRAFVKAVRDIDKRAS